jgi:hypothetical protein
MAININFNFGQNGLGGPGMGGCGCHGGLGANPFGGSPMGGLGGLNSVMAMNTQMMSLLTMTMMAQMMQLLQMLMVGAGVPGSPAQFGGSPAGGSPLSGFLGAGGGGSAPAAGGGSAASGGSSPTSSGDPRAVGGNVDPSTVKDKASTSGLEPAARAGLEMAHRFGLPLVSGKRGGNGKSDHDHGDAIDVGTLPIGAASSTGGTAEMKAFAEFMRQEGKAGRSKVKYIIRDGQIASKTSNWEWRPYTYPGKSQAELERLKQTNRGEYNRLQHYDHVHVSFHD